MTQRYGLAIIGSGAAGFAAAITARELGVSVVMIEADTVGGTCVNTGCVPSKALLAAAAARHSAATTNRFPGLSPSSSSVDFSALMAGKDALVETMRAEKYVDLAAEYGWHIVTGHARFAGSPDQPVLHITAGTATGVVVEAEHYLIATGSTSTTPAIPGLERAGYLTSTTALSLDEAPDSLLVVGGGAIGLEQAQLFARLGATVTVVEAQQRLAPAEEPEASSAIADVFGEEGIAVLTGATISAVERAGEMTVAILGAGNDRRELRARRLLVATGRRPATAALNLDAVGVGVGAQGEVQVDASLRTDNPRVWAAGDVTGAPQYVYVAAAHGVLAATNCLTGTRRAADHTTVPRVTFTSPAIASVGLTQADAAAADQPCACRVLPLNRVPRALVNRDVRGMVKIVAEPRTGRLLGVHAVAEGAPELIAAAGYALAGGLTVERLGELWTPYLTMTEALKLTALSFSRDVTKLSCCAV